MPGRLCIPALVVLALVLAGHGTAAAQDAERGQRADGLWREYPLAQDDAAADQGRQASPSPDARPGAPTEDGGAARRGASPASPASPQSRSADRTDTGATRAIALAAGIAAAVAMAVAAWVLVRRRRGSAGAPQPSAPPVRGGDAAATHAATPSPDAAPASQPSDSRAVGSDATASAPPRRPEKATTPTPSASRPDEAASASSAHADATAPSPSGPAPAVPVTAPSQRSGAAARARPPLPFAPRGADPSCQLQWMPADNGAAELTIVVTDPRTGDSRIMARRPVGPGAEPPAAPTPQCRDAVDALADALMDAGWLPLPDGPEWYARRFTWIHAGDPAAVDQDRLMGARAGGARERAEPASDKR